MPTKTISLELDAYEKLRRARRFPRESFSEVVRRASFGASGITGRELLERLREPGDLIPLEELDRIDRLVAEDSPPDIP